MFEKIRMNVVISFRSHARLNPSGAYHFLLFFCRRATNVCCDDMTKLVKELKTWGQFSSNVCSGASSRGLMQRLIARYLFSVCLGVYDEDSIMFVCLCNEHACEIYVMNMHVKSGQFESQQH